MYGVLVGGVRVTNGVLFRGGKNWGGVRRGWLFYFVPGFHGRGCVYMKYAKNGSVSSIERCIHLGLVKYINCVLRGCFRGSHGVWQKTLGAERMRLIFGRLSFSRRFVNEHQSIS